MFYYTKNTLLNPPFYPTESQEIKMKYEEWIKYEEIRLSQPKEQAGMVWVAFPTDRLAPSSCLTAHQQNDEDDAAPHLWTIIIHYLNSRKI